MGNIAIDAIEVYGTAPAASSATTVTFTNSDLGGASFDYDNECYSITKDGVTLSAGMMRPDMIDGSVTFSTSLGNFTKIEITDGSFNVNGDGWSDGTWNGTPASSVSFSGSIENMGVGITIVCTIAGAAASGYTVSLNDGAENPTTWTASTDGTNFGALPIGGLKGDGSETVTLKYNGRLKVKSVTATSDAAPASVPVTAITLNKTETSIKVGATETLSVTSVLPEEATDKTYTWKTSDASKATVNATTGEVTAVAAGTVTIYAEANDGSGVKGNCTVTVAPATITVTWNNNDMPGTGYGSSFTKDGVTIASDIDFYEKTFMMGGRFTTTLGNFTKIEVTATNADCSGTGWSGNYTKKTWTGTPASSVSFNDNIMGFGGNIQFVFTIEPTN